MVFAIGIVLLGLFLFIWLTILTYRVISTKRENQVLQSENEHLRDQNGMYRRYIKHKLNGEEESESTQEG